MSALPHRSPAERLALILDLLCGATAARGAGGRIAAPLIFLIWTRLRRLGTRFTRLAARIAAGTPPAPARPRAPRTATPRRPHLPRGRHWLTRMVPEAASAGSQLQYLLNEPDMAALIAADHRVGRLLRPLCRTLGIPLPPTLALPPRQPRPPRQPQPPRQAPPASLTPPARPTPPRHGTAPPLHHPAACGPPRPS